MHALANPARFLRFARPATSWLLLIGLALTALGIIAGLTLTPPDYLQGETVRILYVHVPSAWLGMAGWMGIAGASISQIVWRHPLAAVAGRAVAPAGAKSSRLASVSFGIGAPIVAQMLANARSTSATAAPRISTPVSRHGG